MLHFLLQASALGLQSNTCQKPGQDPVHHSSGSLSHAKNIIGRQESNVNLMPVMHGSPARHSLVMVPLDMKPIHQPALGVGPRLFQGQHVSSLPGPYVALPGTLPLASGAAGTADKGGGVGLRKAKAAQRQEMGDLSTGNSGTKTCVAGEIL
eukprot:1157867-Pelagomonas_calceolata.AAC.3